MNPEAIAMLEAILAKEENALTPGDKAFLRARSKYISNKDKARYANVLSGEDAPEEQTDSGAEEVETEEEDNNPFDDNQAEG